MRLLPTLILLSLTACAAAPRIVGTSDDFVVAAKPLAAELAKADVVVLGELHGITSVHRTHHEIIEEIHAVRPNMVIAMEMFERDVQSDLLQYLGGVIDEAVFLERSRPWKDYARDYRPVIEFARQHKLVVLAANAPRELARKVSMEGVESVAGDPNVARNTTAPKDGYWDAFVEAMGEHGGMAGDDAMERFYAAQCLKDDTMAESVCDHLKEHAGPDQPIAVLICGKMHSDFRRGAVQRIVARMPELKVRVLSAEIVDDYAGQLYESPRPVADYVIVTKEKMPEPKMPAVRAAAKVPVHAIEIVEEHEGEEHGEEENEEGLRPALGFMPGYGGTESGVPVESLREGGPAERGGLREGDVIVAIAGEEVEDINDYTEVLGTLKIGSKVPVRVKRGDERVELSIVVGSRTR